MKRTTLEKVKTAFIEYKHNWPAERPVFSGYEMARMVAVLTTFARYILPAYENFFVENDRGPALIRCISDTGIRVEYFEGPMKGDAEWIQAEDFIGNADATERTFAEQPASVLFRNQPVETQTAKG